ncbi:NUDIX hydrolase [Nocardioides marmorisolisilvae]|uniref:CoA pyrophosphatase n=1 Tax=Nocardioides marmorisolisilvae TaxID=1542737 RepID=A0A3N0DWY9_9ACTN|nr:CoA pyrophosphatase [Nocardioides marmorisolisilvae]RNL80130.1 CoA pyrophosphatase [Nocardioides marmorisolisilvae]
MANGQVDAAVLIPIFEGDRGPVIVYTERSADLRKHAGEISFPGGRQDPGETLLQTALREAEEEIGLPRDSVEIVDELDPIGTFVSGFRVFPFVGRIPAGSTWTPHPVEVAAVLELPLVDVRAGHRFERLWSKGVPVRTDTYTVDGHLIWGATARITRQLLDRLPG